MIQRQCPTVVKYNLDVSKLGIDFLLNCQQKSLPELERLANIMHVLEIVTIQMMNLLWAFLQIAVAWTFITSLRLPLSHRRSSKSGTELLILMRGRSVRLCRAAQERLRDPVGPNG